MRLRIGSTAVMACVLLLVGLRALGADKNGVSPQVISLPSGPGSISGMGESFQPQLNSGSAAYSVPIQLPSGPSGFAPKLLLQYQSGSGNGPVGIGWKLAGATAISRNMDRGLPLYVDADNGLDDDFDGAVDNPDEIDRFSGVDLEELLALPDATFRGESEETFMQYRRTPSGWEARSKSGARQEFGTTAAARIESGERIFSWLLERATDLNGNAITYHYMAEPSSPGQKYCREIRWAGTDAFYAAVMHYQSGRLDVHSDYRSGFEVRTALRLLRIDVIVQGVPPPPGAFVGDSNNDGTPDALIRRYVLGYEQQGVQSLLRSVTLFGSDGVTSMPPMTFAYTEWTPPDEVSSSMILSSGEPDAALNSADVELIDMNRDGLPDLLEARADLHIVYLNLGVDPSGRLAWDTKGELVGNAPGINLGLNAVHLADHTADGEADLINKVNENLIQCHINSGLRSWQDPVNLGNTDSWPRWPFENLGSRTLDTDHNRMHDVLFTSANTYSLWMLMPGGRYGKEVALPVLSDGVETFSFANPGARIADVNGDRISDLVWIQSTQVVYWASCGRGTFDGPIFLPLAETLSIDEVARSDFADLNGDGLADLAIIRPDLSPEGIDYYLSRGLQGFDPLRTIAGLPVAELGDAVRCADMNGNGSVDLLISNSSRPAGSRAQYLDFVPGIRPHLLRRIDNGLGLITTIDYETSIQQMVRAGTAGQPWTSTMPMSTPVVARITEDDSRGNHYIREITYRDPYYDAVKQEFRGFSRAELRDVGDDSAPTQITQHVFDTGTLADCRKGKLLTQVVLDEKSSQFERMDNAIQHRALAKALGGGEVCYAVTESTETQIIEKSETPIVTRTEYVYDDFGNLLHQNQHGIVGQSGDEVFVENAYTYDPSRWLMDRVLSTTTSDGDGARVAETLFTYDERGNPLEQRAWLNTDDRYIRTIRNEYDSFGNVIRRFDANDHSRTIVYDPLLHMYAISETVHLDTYDLTITGDYHLGFGTVVSAVDFAGATTHVEYDALARQIKVLGPDGAEIHYAYELGAPISRIITRVREDVGGGTFDSYVYVDGLGRALGSKVEAEEGQWRFLDAVAFNQRKLEQRLWLPYFTKTNNYENPAFDEPFLSMSYDARGRNAETVNPDGTSTRVLFEPLIQHLHDEKDTAGADTPTTQRSDGLGRLVEVIERNNAEEYHTTYSWNTLGKLVEISDAQGNKKRMTYDSLQRNLSLNDPDLGMMTYEYDDVGNLLRATDAKAQTIAYSYDFANRILSENYLDQGGGMADPIDVAYVYDLPGSDVSFGDGSSGTATFTGGRMSSVRDLSGEEYLSYDARGNVLWTVKRIRDPLLGVLTSYKTGFVYDVMSRLVEIVYPDYDRCLYSYNSANFLERIDGGPGGRIIVADAAQEPTGQLSRLNYGNGVITTYEYDNRDRLVALRTVSPKAGELINYAYSFDPISNITRIADNRPFDGPHGIPADSPRRNTQLFQYDDLYRLTQVKYSPQGDGAPVFGQLDYAYDKIGNMRSQVSPPAGQPGHIPDPKVNLGTMTSGGTAGSHNRVGRAPGDPPGPHALTATQTGGALDYDDNGNMTTLDGATLTWDFLDRLIRYQKGRTDARYTYDYTGRRITKLVTENGQTDQTLYVNQYFEYRPNRAPIKYVFSDTTRVAQVKSAIDPQRPLVQRIWLWEKWTPVTIAVEAFATVEEMFGPDATVYGWGGTDYTRLPAGAIVPVGAALWVRVGTARVAIARGIYNPPTDPIPVQAGDTLIAWAKLEPFVPSDHLPDQVGRIMAYEPLRARWLVGDPALPPEIGDTVAALPGGATFWFASPAPTALFPDATTNLDVTLFHGDHLGSASVASDENDALAWETDYYPFGSVRHTHEPGAFARSPYGFSQKEQDGESGLHYLEARYLGAEISRFISPDPKFANPALLSPEDFTGHLSRPQNLNLYSYGINNPLSYTDPSGLDIQEIGVCNKEDSVADLLSKPLTLDPSYNDRPAPRMSADNRSDAQRAIDHEKGRRSRWDQEYMDMIRFGGIGGIIAGYKSEYGGATRADAIAAGRLANTLIGFGAASATHAPARQRPGTGANPLAPTVQVAGGAAKGGGAAFAPTEVAAGGGTILSTGGGVGAVRAAPVVGPSRAVMSAWEDKIIGFVRQTNGVRDRMFGEGASFAETNAHASAEFRKALKQFPTPK